MERSRGNPTTTRRWHQWQTSLLAQRYLPREAAAQGYTLLKIAPECTTAFFVCVAVLQAGGHCTPQHDLARMAPWQEWETWTRRFAAYLDRLATGRDGTRAPRPGVLRALLDGQEVLDG